MKKTALVSLFAILFATNAFSADEYCMYGDQKVALDEYVSHVDPVIVSEIKSGMEKQGYSKEAIENELKYNDWTVIHLVCVRTYNYNPQYSKSDALAKGQKAGMIKVNGYALVPVVHQIQWVEKMLNLSETSY